MGEQFPAEDGAFILLEAPYRARGKPAGLLFSLRDSKTLIKNKKGTASPFITDQRNRTQHRVKRVAGRECKDGTTARPGLRESDIACRK